MLNFIKVTLCMIISIKTLPKIDMPKLCPN